MMKIVLDKTIIVIKGEFDETVLVTLVGERFRDRKPQLLTFRKLPLGIRTEEE